MAVGTVLLTILFSVNWNGNGGIFAGADWIGSLIYATTIVMPIIIITDKSLSRTEQARIGVIYIIAFFVIFFWAAYEQAGASLTFFADEQTDRHIGGWEMPAAYFPVFQSDYDCNTCSYICRHLVIPWQTGHRTQFTA